MAPCATLMLAALALSAAPLATADSSSSQSSTASATTSRSRTQTPALSIFPLQTIIDNTATLQNVVTDSSQPASGQTWWGVSLYWPEADATCGPGSYTLTDLYLAIGPPVPSGVALSVSVNLSVSLFVADSGSLLPHTFAATAQFTVLVAVTFPGPKTIRVPLNAASPALVVNTTLSPFWVLAWHSWTPDVTWHDVDAQTDVPDSGAAESLALLESRDGGATYLPSNATYGGIWLKGRKIVCSPTPSTSQSQTFSASSSGAATPSLSTSATRSPSAHMTPSQSLSGTASGTSSAAVSRVSFSATRSPAPSISRSSTATPFVSPSRTASRTGTGFPPASIIGALDSFYHDLSAQARTLSSAQVSAPVSELVCAMCFTFPLPPWSSARLAGSSCTGPRRTRTAGRESTSCNPFYASAAAPHDSCIHSSRTLSPARVAVPLCSTNELLAGQENVTVFLQLFAYYPGLNATFAYTADPSVFVAGDALPGDLVLVASTQVILWFISTPAWWPLPLGGSFIVDANVTSFYVMTWSTLGRAALWSQDSVDVRTRESP